MLLRVLNFDLRIIQSEGCPSVYARPFHTTDEWQSIDSLLMAIDDQRTLPPPPVYGSLRDLDCLLESRLDRLNNALSPECFASTVQAARQAYRKGLVAVQRRVPVQLSTTQRVFMAALQGIAKSVRFLLPKPKDSQSKLLPVGSDAALEREVRKEFGNLFAHFGAQVISNGRLRIMDFATVTFDVGNIRVRACRDRGFVNVSIAPTHLVREWIGVGVAVQALGETESGTQTPLSSDLHGAGKLLENEFVKLNEAFARDNYPASRERIQQLQQNLTQKWMDDFNQKNRVLVANRGSSSE